jgi:lysophospholipase L1-like esterase
VRVLLATVGNNQQLVCLLAGLALSSACSSQSAGSGAGGGSAASGSGGVSSGGNPAAAGGFAGSGGASPGSGGTAAGSPGIGTAGVGGTAGSAVAGGSGGTAVGGNASGGAGTAGAGTAGAGTAGAGGSAGSGGGSSTNHWVGTWTGAPQLTETANLPPASLSNSALRQVVHVSLGGSQIRVRFSNEFGNGPVTINQAHAAVCKATPVDSTIDTTTDKALSFSGMPSTTIAQGMAVWSDPLDFTVAALSNLSISTAFGNVPSNVTGHPGSRTTSYEQTGSSTVTAANMTSAQTADHWYILSGVDVMAAAAAKGLVILGDSISDGRGSTTNGNDRWPDDLAKRLQANAATTQVAVMNQGIGGNTVTTGGLGPTAASRFSRDVLGQSGVRWVIIFEGVNDIGADVGAPAITAAFATMISQAHAQNLLVYGATITPFGANTYYSVAHETARQAVNTYVKSGAYDGYIDLNAAVSDTSNPPKLPAAYDSGDGLHLTPAGYQKLADTVDLTLFTK